MSDHMNINNNNMAGIAMADPLNQHVGRYEDRPAAASRHQLSEEEKWRLQEEQWANAEQARYGSGAAGNLSNNNFGLSAIRSTSDSEMAVPFNSPAGTASNNNSIRNHPNLMADDTAPMDAERFGKLRSYYDRSGQGNTMASDLAGIQPQSNNIQQQSIPSELQEVYNDDQKHFEQHKQISENALLEELNAPARLHHQQLQQKSEQSPLHEEQQPLLPHQVPDQQLQDQPLSHRQQQPLREKQFQNQDQQLPRLLKQHQPLQNNFVDPNLDVNAGQNSYYGSVNTDNKSSITSGNASTKSLVKEDGIAPYGADEKANEASLSTKSPAIVTSASIAEKILQANHNFDERNIVEHGAIMTAESERYNAVAEAIGIPRRIDETSDIEQGSPTAFLDDALILEEKAKQAALERRIAERNARLKQDEIKEEHSRELDGVSAATGPAIIEQKQSNEQWDEKASGDNFVSMGKPHDNQGLSPSALRARELKQQQQSAGLMESETKKKETSPQMADALRAQLNMPGRINPEDGIPLGAQTYTGQPPQPIAAIHEDIPDVWLEKYRQETIERRVQKETQRRVEMNRKESEGGFANKIAAVFDDTKASFKKSKQEHDLKEEDRQLANNNHRAKERMSKYFPMHTSERFVCAFDAQALHHHMAFAGHLILTDKTLCFVGKGYEDAELVANDVAAASAPSSYNNRLNNNNVAHEKKDLAGHAHKKEHILVKEAIPLANIASIAMGSVVKNNGQVFVMDATDSIVVADALQLFTTDGRILQFRSFSHPCVTKKGKSYDGRTVPALHRFLNYLDHKWRAIGGGNMMQQQHAQAQPQQQQLPAREGINSNISA